MHHMFLAHMPFFWWCKVENISNIGVVFFLKNVCKKVFFPNIHTLISLKFEWIRPKVKVIIQSNVSFQTFLFQITQSKTANLSSTLCEKQGLHIVRFRISYLFAISVQEKNIGSR